MIVMRNKTRNGQYKLFASPLTPSYGHGLTNVLFYLPLSGTRGNQNGLVINYELAIM